MEFVSSPADEYHHLTLEFYAFASILTFMTLLAFMEFDTVWAVTVGPGGVTAGPGSSSPSDMGAFVLGLMCFLTFLGWVGVRCLYGTNDYKARRVAVHTVLLWGYTTFVAGYTTWETGTFQPNNNGTLVSKTSEVDKAFTGVEQPTIWRWNYANTNPTMVAGWVLVIFVWAAWVWLVTFVVFDHIRGTDRTVAVLSWEGFWLWRVDYFEMTPKMVDVLFYFVLFGGMVFAWGSLVGSAFYQLNIVQYPGSFWGYERPVAIVVLAGILLGAIFAFGGLHASVMGRGYVGRIIYGTSKYEAV